MSSLFFALVCGTQPRRGGKVNLKTDRVPPDAARLRRQPELGEGEEEHREDMVKDVRPFRQAAVL